MIIIIESQKKKRILVRLELRRQTIISKNDTINTIPHFIEQKALSILEYLGIILSRNFSYMINLRFIVLIIKLDQERQNLRLLLFRDMEGMFPLIDLSIIWIILKTLISILIKRIICLIIWLEFRIIKDMCRKVSLILKEIKGLIVFLLKGKISLNFIIIFGDF